jgi:hypothetical protein
MADRSFPIVVRPANAATTDFTLSVQTARIYDSRFPIPDSRP